MVSIKVEYEVICALSNGDIADDLECPLTTPIFCILQHHSLGTCESAVCVRIEYESNRE